MSDEASPPPVRENSRLDNSHLLDGSDLGAMAPSSDAHPRSDGRMDSRVDGRMDGRKDNRARSDSEDSILDYSRRRDPKPVKEVRVHKKPGPKPSGK